MLVQFQRCHISFSMLTVHSHRFTKHQDPGRRVVLLVDYYSMFFRSYCLLVQFQNFRLSFSRVCSLAWSFISKQVAVSGHKICPDYALFGLQSQNDSKKEGV